MKKKKNYIDKDYLNSLVESYLKTNVFSSELYSAIEQIITKYYSSYKFVNYDSLLIEHLIDETRYQVIKTLILKKFKNTSNIFGLISTICIRTSARKSAQYCKRKEILQKYIADQIPCLSIY